MRYPKLNNWLVFRRKDEITYDVRDCLNDEELTMGVTIAGFARKLDGKHDPFQVDDTLTWEEVIGMLYALEEHGLLRHSMVLSSSGGSVYRTLWFPRNCPLVRTLAALCNSALEALWLPTFAFGLWLYAKCMPPVNSDQILMGSVLGIVFGAMLHELAHASAGLAYGARVFEVGVMLEWFIPGVYVLMDAENVRSRLKRVQISTAGAEANMLLAGMCFVLACVHPDVGTAMLCAAVSNVLLAVLNITF